MAEEGQQSMLDRLLKAIGLRNDEIAAGHGTLPEGVTRPSTYSRRRSREQQRERAPEEESERAADAIAQAAGDLDKQIRDSVRDPNDPKTSDEMVREAKERWSSD